MNPSEKLYRDIIATQEESITVSRGLIKTFTKKVRGVSRESARNHIERQKKLIEGSVNIIERYQSKLKGVAA